MSCRFPDAPDVLSFWQNILQSRTSFQELRHQRWNHKLCYSPQQRTANATTTKAAGLLDDVESFAAAHFKISPKRARHMDPQQRLMLEVSREALQDAGLERRPWNQEESAVFVGVNLSEYGNLLSTPLRADQLQDGQFGESRQLHPESCRDVIPANAYTLLGSNISMCASCVAQEFNCGGPALVLDAACAAGMAAVVQGVQYLRALGPTEGESPVAIVGGVYLLLVPDNAVCFSKLGALAETECRPFDSRSSGFLLGEGAASLVLKRASDAEADGDRIYALIKGVAWNNDGTSESPATPSHRGQVRVMQAGLKDAQFAPETVDYVECHGTGTAVGDPIEMASLSEVFAGPGYKPRLGSVKANIGHTLAASGPAGLIRATMAVYESTLPPQAAWESWHPDLEAYAEQFTLPRSAESWNKTCRRAVVSSFAFGGTNCFVALEAARPESSETSSDQPRLFCLSAAKKELLADYVRAVGSALSAGVELASVARTLFARTPQRFVAFLICSDLGELKSKLEALAEPLSEPWEGWVKVGESVLIGDSEASPEVDVSPALGLALSSVSEQTEELRELTGGHGPLTTLPSSPLERRSFWMTKRR